MSTSRASRQRGMTLIELIVFIVVVSVGLAGVLSVFNVAVRNSADPLITKQALAVADALLEEILLKDFCDPTPAVASTANLTSGSPGLAAVSPASGVAVGWRASGYGIPAGT
ncbi:MAG TPA: type II secretion system protein, partial [Rhodocyclaceae bacterium]|nr:type II secretion system protein [Rhodocyclaceae bacterium]